VVQGFSSETVSPADHDSLRPNYAPEEVAWVAQRAGLGPGSLVVDLAAGTGQLSKRLATLGVDILAVERARNMRSLIEERLPTVRASGRSAAALPPGGDHAARWIEGRGPALGGLRTFGDAGFSGSGV
jgi:hypothetical protein